MLVDGPLLLIMLGIQSMPSQTGGLHPILLQAQHMEQDQLSQSTPEGEVILEQLRMELGEDLPVRIRIGLSESAKALFETQLTAASQRDVDVGLEDHDKSSLAGFDGAPMMATRADFELAFMLLIGHEGVYSNDSRDRGNWTSGVIGKGELKGTKYGIAAHVYPNLDIKNLTLAQAHEIYYIDYWSRAGCLDMPPRLAFVVFDAAVNNGVGAAVKWLQLAVGVTADGVYGNITRGAVQKAAIKDETNLVVEVHAHRLRMMCELSTWKTFRGGWSRRLVKVPFEAANYWTINGGQT